MNTLNTTAAKATIVEWFEEQGYTDYTVQESSNLWHSFHEDLFCNVTIQDDNVAVAFKLRFESKMGRRKTTSEIIQEMTESLTKNIDRSWQGMFVDKCNSEELRDQQALHLVDYLDIMKSTYYTRLK